MLGSQTTQPDDEDRFVLPNGYRLNDYRIRRVLGCGGFGVTYLALDERLHRDVAIKEYMPADLALRQTGSLVVPRSGGAHRDYGDGLRRFLTEAQTLARFSHRNIVRVQRYFEANGTGYIVMDYEAGQCLGDRLKVLGGPLPADELVAIAAPLLDGIAAVHEAGFLHRDIKPSNIFIRADGSPVLLDFGTARQFAGHASRSLVSILTPGYAPFEQYNAKNDLGPCADIYGMGAVLYTCISGRVPPEAPARAQARMDKVPDPLRPASEVGRGRYPDRFLQAIDRSLAVLPRDRLKSAAELRAALLSAPPASSRLTERWPALAAGAGAVLLAAIVAVVLLRDGGGPPVLSGVAEAARPEPPRQDGTASAAGDNVAVAAAGTTFRLPAAPTALQDEVAFGTAREAMRASVDYGRQSQRRTRQAEAVPSLERLAAVNTRYQKQLDEVRQGLDLLDQAKVSLLQHYVGLVEQLARQPDSFRRIRDRLLALDLPEADRLARQQLIEHVEAKAGGPTDAAAWRSGLDRAYASRELW